MKSSVNLKIVAVLILVILPFIILNLTGLAKEIKNFFYLISSPVEKTLWQAGESVSRFLGGVFKIGILNSEIDFLSLKNQELLSQIAVLRELKKENETLRQAMGLGLERDFQLELSQIVSKDPSSDSILINKGEGDGLSKGQAVITSQRVLVGRIGQVYRDFAEVVLITDKESAFDAKISGQEIYGVAKGKGNLRLFLDFIPKEEEIAAGDIVITTPLGGIFPKDLLVGEIKEVKKSDIESFLAAEIIPGFHLEKLNNLFIVVGQND